MSNPIPPRPEHPDMEVIASIMSTYDMRMDVADDDAKEEVWLELVGQIVDRESLIYAAMQRAYRATGAQTVADVQMMMPQIARLSSAWLEGFVVGAMVERQRREVQEGRDE